MEVFPCSTAFHILTPVSSTTSPDSSCYLRVWRLFENTQVQLPLTSWTVSLSLGLPRPYVEFSFLLMCPWICALLAGFFSLPFKKDLPENQTKSEMSKRLISLQAYSLISCLLYFHLKYLWTWGNIYFHDRHSLGFRVKGQCSNSVIFLRFTYFFLRGIK